MQITRDRGAGTLTTSQKHYTKSILVRFCMAGWNPVHTSGAGADRSLDQLDGTLQDPTGTELYQSSTGSLMCLSQCTRYNITYAVNHLARAMSRPSKLHMTAAKDVLKFLKGNMSLAPTHRTGCFAQNSLSQPL